MEDGPRTFSFSDLSEDHANRASFGPPPFANLRVLLALTLGIGKSSWSALTYDEILWWFWHKQFVDKWVDATWQPCPILTTSDIRWDLVQVLTFVGTAGSFVGERRGTITHDGYLLITHKLHQVPKNLQKQFYNPKSFTLTTFIVLWLTKLIMELCWKDRKTMSEKVDDLESPPSDKVCKVSTTKGLGDHLKIPGRSMVKDGEELRVITQGECLLPVESTRATGSTANIIFDNTPCLAARSQAEITSPSPNDEDSQDEDIPYANETSNLPAPVSRQSDYRCFYSGYSRSLDHNANAAPTPWSARKVIMFQHGLLESSTSYIFPLWSAGPNDTVIHVPLRIIRYILLPVYLITRLIRYIIRQFSCAIPTTRNRECLTRMKYSLPIHAMLADPSADVWLTNTRGSEFSCNLRDQISSCMPSGSRRLMYNEYRQIFSLYTKEHWTYVDSAVLDSEAMYNMLFRYYRTSKLSITVVAFSQGCAVFALHAAMKAKLIQQDDNSNTNSERQFEKTYSPPNFPLISSSQHYYNASSFDELNQDIAYSSPRPGSALVVTTPAYDELDEESLGADRSSLSVDCEKSEDGSAAGHAIHSGWTSEIFSSIETYGFDVLYREHLRGNCAGLRGACEFCGILPSYLVLIAPPFMLQHLTAPAKTLGECWRVVFCKTAWTHLHYLVTFVSIFQSFLHVRLGLLGQLFTQYILCFGIRPIHRDVADLIYKLVPSGMTTRDNMMLWNSQMDDSSLLGSDMKYIHQSKEFARSIWKVSELPSGVQLDSCIPCPTSIYAGIQDNIADSISAAGRFVQNGNASLRVLDAQNRCCQVQVDTKSKVAVNLVAGSSHIDILWPASNVRLIQYIMNDIISTNH